MTLLRKARLHLGDLLLALGDTCVTLKIEGRPVTRQRRTRQLLPFVERRPDIEGRPSARIEHRRLLLALAAQHTKRAEVGRLPRPGIRRRRTRTS